MARADEVPHGWMMGRVFVISPRWAHDGFHGFYRGDQVRVVMVSRFGDVGVTKDMDAEYGYDVRLAPSDLTPVNQRPKNVCEKCNYVHDAGECLKPVDLTEGV